MGAKQRGQARKQKTTKGGLKGSPRSQKQLNKSISIPDLEPASRGRALQGWQSYAQSAPSARDGWSMNEQARNTDRRGFGWSSTPLRNNAITFVSAGVLRRDDDDEDEVEAEKVESETEITSTKAQATDSAPKLPMDQEPVIETPPDERHAPPAPPQHAQDTAIPAVVISSTDPKESDDSEDSDEEIVFAGRQASAQPSRSPSVKPGPVPVTHTVTTTTVKSTIEVVASTPLGLESPLDHPAPSSHKSNRRSNLRGWNDEEAIMQDYIDNMALDDSEEEEEIANGADKDEVRPKRAFKKLETFRFFEGSGAEHVKVQTIAKSPSQRPRLDLEQAADWNSDDLADFDDLSTTDEEFGAVSQIIRHRERPSGHQYLVVAEGSGASDAKWVLRTKLVSESANDEIKIYEEIRAMNVSDDEYEDLDDDNEEEDSDEEDEEALQDLIDNIESEDDENARILHRTARMTDEQIALALAKQEEMGLGSDELLLFNGHDGIDEVPFDMDHDFIPFDAKMHTLNRGRSKRNKKQRDSFPSAEAFADALDQDPYGAFDVMDFDRPSLRPKKKGRKSDYPFDLEGLDDEDLRDQLMNTWTKDREKKAARKREREEARLTATLDVADASDPAVIKHRIRRFLVQDVEILKLSPMDAPLRASVHRIAKALSLNSRSEGKEGVGVGRYPVLSKTARTPHYSIDTIWEIDALLNQRKFFPKNTGFNRKGGTPRNVARRERRGGGGVMSGATYRDGETVAASAPEIGAENRGRAMLEKMGWTAGTGIGAIGNKGGLDPIKHVVKTTKAGLG